MPFYNDDTRIITHVDDYEVKCGIRCQHCGHEGPLMMSFYCAEPGYNARCVL